jgi:hypothetical protein
VGEWQRYRLDDLRRLGVGLAVGVGVVPARASAFVSGLLWYEAADASEYGIGSLPGWLDAIDRGDVDPKAEGKIIEEHTATAVLDGQRGIAPLILARAALVGQEKAREVGVGMVWVVNLAGYDGPVAEVVAEIAVGPMVGTIAGSMGLAVAVPVEGSMPAVFDSRLDPNGWTGLPPWSDGSPDGPVVTARAVSAFESLASVHEHVGMLLEINPALPGEVRPDAWQARRLEQMEHGLILSAEAAEALRGWADRLGVRWPGAS